MKIANCPICNKTSVLFPFKSFSLYRCTNCQLIFRHPLPSSSEVTNIYANNDYFSFWGNKENILRIHQMKVKTSGLLLREVQSLLKQQNSPSLLDVGCATGALLEKAKKLGFTITGIEMNKHYAQIAQKITKSHIYTQAFEEIFFKPNSFDVLVFFDVLEHVRDINFVIQKSYTILKPGGLLTISTPDTGSLSFKLLGKFWPHFKSEHLYYFHAKSLTQLLQTYGLQVVLIKPSLKVLTLDYIKNYFLAYKIPVLSSLIKFFFTFIPKSFFSLSITIPTGNILFVAKKLS